MNVLPVYDMGITGKGVTVVVLDDGLEGSHVDLRKNYVIIIMCFINRFIGVGVFRELT